MIQDITPDAVVKVLRAHKHNEACLKRLQYEGALELFLKSQEPPVTREIYMERRAQRNVCVCCAGPHLLYSCPKYLESGLSTVQRKTQERERELHMGEYNRFRDEEARFDQARSRWRSKEERLKAELRERNQAQDRTQDYRHYSRAGQNKLFREEFHQNRGQQADQGHARVTQALALAEDVEAKQREFESALARLKQAQGYTSSSQRDADHRRAAPSIPEAYHSKPLTRGDSSSSAFDEDSSGSDRDQAAGLLRDWQRVGNDPQGSRLH